VVKIVRQGTLQFMFTIIDEEEMQDFVERVEFFELGNLLFIYI